MIAYGDVYQGICIPVILGTDAVEGLEMVCEWGGWGNRCEYVRGLGW